MLPKLINISRRFIIQEFATVIHLLFKYEKLTILLEKNLPSYAAFRNLITWLLPATALKTNNHSSSFRATYNEWDSLNPLHSLSIPQPAPRALFIRPLLPFDTSLSAWRWRAHPPYQISLSIHIVCMRGGLFNARILDGTRVIECVWWVFEWLGALLVHVHPARTHPGNRRRCVCIQRDPANNAGHDLSPGMIGIRSWCFVVFFSLAVWVRVFFSHCGGSLSESSVNCCDPRALTRRTIICHFSALIVISMIWWHMSDHKLIWLWTNLEYEFKVYTTETDTNDLLTPYAEQFQINT